MKSFLLAPFVHRLTVVLGISLTLVSAWFAVLVLGSLDSWKRQAEAARIWESGQKERCERLFEQAGAEIAAIDHAAADGLVSPEDIIEAERRRLRNSLRFGEAVDPDELAADRRQAQAMGISVGALRLSRQDGVLPTPGFDNLLPSERRRRAIIQSTSNSDCPQSRSGNNFYATSQNEELPTLITNKQPDPIIIDTYNRYNLSISIIFAYFALLVSGLMILVDSTKRSFLDFRVGWRRLSIVGSSISAALVSGFWLWKRPDDNFLLASIPAFIISFAALTYGKIVFDWVSDGFAAEKGPAAVMQRRSESAAADPDPVAIIAEQEARPVTFEKAEDQPLAAAPFWPRLWARCLDLSVCWFAGSFAVYALPSFRSMSPGVGGILADLLAGIAYIGGSVFLYERLFISRFGATPGKMLFAISVRSLDGGLPSPKSATLRSWVFLKSGLYLCVFFPTLQIVGAISAWRRRSVTQPWDIAARTFTWQRPIGSARLISGALVAISMFVLLVGLHNVAKEATREEISRFYLDRTAPVLPEAVHR
ncbi:RDD family protein [Brevundimonas sp. TWP2-3-4b1]|uniref:RDD family protein n=1 Tax=Brevundimonas sp. TWP2-3-4b1 TaxID=2804580 RepID=UPI003CF008EC